MEYKIYNIYYIMILGDNMGINRSKYEFDFLGDKALLNNLINSYLKHYEFSLTKKDGEEFYKTPSTIDGTKAFRYTIFNNKLIIEAWLISGAGDMAVDGIYSIFSKNYKESLDLLFKRIGEINKNAIDSGYVERKEAMENKEAKALLMKQKEAAKEKRLNKNSDISLLMAFIALLLSITGFAFVTFFMVMAIYFAIMGIKSKRKYESILALILTAISIGIFIFKIYG